MSNVRSPYVQTLPFGNSFDDIEKGKVASEFADSIIRQGFVRKVFGLLGAQLLVTVLIGATILGSPTIKSAVLGNGAFLLLAFALSIVPLLYLAISEKARHQFPLNLILMAIFTIGEGVLVSACTARYNTDIVILALGITAAVTVSLCAYALTTKHDFTSMGSYLYAALLSLFVAGLVGYILHTPLLTLAISTGGAALFSMYIVYDVQMLMGGQHQYKVTPDEYVFAAINIYLDIINLFLYILRILNEMKGDRN
ncbi:hypothetical protein CEUSTIGMA_g10547.t1 [Chlamydomonas eustigma]|uniref:Uncharacterized protein n=1 Tax=Chlamydomonas eustigma TaxID=1157962 RepID=A0A250XJ60_9CHLO|nr:hypothetical protein CEUSTIGMA_g10547.t1 [Chlamydomonas eustigma]|eukprot:GAX83121.1 hypothetical protein CEUSTIGMA_g10547.t1 [Chlamydomonas eustigma]